jgi:hypothetical protein
LPSALQQLFGQSPSTVHCCLHDCVPYETQIELQHGLALPHGSPTATQLAHSAAVPHTLRLTLPNFKQQPEVQSPSISQGMRQIGLGVAWTHSLPAQHVAPLAPQLTSTGRQPPTPLPAPPPVPETPPVLEPPVANPPAPDAPPVPAEPLMPALPLTPPLAVEPPLEEDAAVPPAPPDPPAEDALDPPLALPALPEVPPELVLSESESLLQPLAAAAKSTTLPKANVSRRTSALSHERYLRANHPHAFRRIRATLFSSEA